ncbi:hypothetical protein [Streptomyces sp. NPDC056160]|uniref:hypothetical protein n=1 Tax=Streptomyces sp. NPDC056160 TaxID=3345731 RepID=UPI0035DFDD30
MNYRPYPDAARARHQLERGRTPELPPRPFANITEFQAYVDSGEFSRRMRALGETFAAFFTANQARRAGRSAITAAILDQKVKAGKHVDVASGDGIRCVGGDEDCTAPGTEPGKCGFLHDKWWDGIYRERRRCIAPAGHTGGQFAYDHGPWESVPDSEVTP